MKRTHNTFFMYYFLINLWVVMCFSNCIKNIRELNIDKTKEGKGQNPKMISDFQITGQLVARTKNEGLWSRIPKYVPTEQSN